MRIKKMTATFGGLDHAVLEPGCGLTILTAPNEGGKSTWAAFLRAMLYGINTRERDKEGYLAEKNRYAPWSGAPMEGEMQVEWRGEDITLRRFARRTSPFGGFEAVYTASGDPVPGLTADNVGEMLIGAGREMYERSAFVGQGSTTAIGGGAELERRIAALATTGEEEVSFTQTQRTLKDWLNRRRANKSNGILPELDGELLQVRESIAALERSRQEGDSARRRLEALEEEHRELEAELDIHKRIRQQELDRRYGQALLEWQKAVAAVPQEGKHPVFGSMTADEAWAYAQERVEEQHAAEEERRQAEQEREQLALTEKQWKKMNIIFTVLAALFAILLAVLVVKSSALMGIVSESAVLIFMMVGVFFSARKKRNAAEQFAAWKPVEVPDAGDILEQAAAYREDLAKTAQAKAAAEAAKRLVDELAAQGGREFTTLEYLHPPVRSMTETMTRLRMVEDEMAHLRRALDIMQGKMDTMGNIDELYASLDSLNAGRAERQREFDALTIAMEALNSANDTLRQRFSPELNRRAGELFARLSGGQYAALGLSRSFDASATPAGEMLPRSALALSQGTVEQLYLAVRLAVCGLTLAGEEPPPLVLDDALANFDDRRMELALELLRELADERQILLFSCHSREAQWARARGVSVCHLQSAEQ